MPSPKTTLAILLGSILAAALPVRALLDPCSFNFGMSWDKGPSFPDEVGYVTIWTNQGFDGGYHGSMLNALKSTNKTPVFYGYLIAKTSGLADCDVATGASLCSEGANYIRRNMGKILNAYGSFAQSAAQIWGTQRQIVFLIEPDFYQYFQSGQQGGDPIPQDSAKLIMGQIHDKVRQYLPQAEFSFDISPWISQKLWFARFDTADFAWGNTSGGRTQGGDAKIRSENTLTWAAASSSMNRGIIADVGYGVGGGADNAGIASWNDAANLNARIADGVVGITNTLADYSWGNTLKTLRPKLTGTLKSCVETGPKTTRFALTTTVAGNGSVARDLAGPLYDSGSAVRIAALPQVGYRFVSWSGAATGTNPVATIPMVKAQAVTATFELSPAGPPQGTGTDLVRGGDFASASADWSLAVNCGAATGSVQGGAWVANVTDAGSAGYCLQFRQTGLNLESGKTYVFSFDAKASAARTLIGYVGQAGDPYTNYLLGTTGDWTVSLTNSVQTFSKTFTMTTSDPSGRIDLNLGGAGTGTVTIDNVSLRSGRALPKYALATTVTGPSSNRVVRVPDQASYDSGATVALFAVPDSVTAFAGWTGDAAGALATALVVVDGPKSITAVFGNTAVHGRALRPVALRRVGDELLVAQGTGSSTIALRTPTGALVRLLHDGGPTPASLALPRDLAPGLYLVDLRTASGHTSLPIVLQP